MAQIIENGGGGKSHGKRKAKKHGTHIDMTPMVDLACLLLTFFMLTTAFSKPKVMEIIMPEKPKPNEPLPKNPQEIPKSRTLNLVLGKGDVVYWYFGKPGTPLEGTTVQKTNFSKDGIRKILLLKNKDLFEKIETLNTKVIKGTEKIGMDTLQARIRRFKKDDKLGPIVLIKADDDIKYKNMVDVIDEMAITNIARYSLVDIDPKEKQMIHDVAPTLK